MLSDASKPDLSLLYLMKKQKDQTKLFDIIISFKIQIEKKVVVAVATTINNKKVKTKLKLT